MLELYMATQKPPPHFQSSIKLIIIHFSYSVENDPIIRPLVPREDSKEVSLGGGKAEGCGLNL